MIRWMLESLERDPHTVFYEKELSDRFPGEFKEAVERRLLRRVPVGESYGYGLTRPRTLVSMAGGGYEAVDDEDPEAEPIKLTASDVARWRLDMDQLGRMFQATNGLTGEPGTLSPRLHFLGELGSTAVVLGLLQEEQAVPELAALPAILPKTFETTTVVTPTFVPSLEMAKSSVLATVSFASLGDPDPLELELAQSSVENIFRKEGDNWLIKFKGRTNTVRNLKGLEHMERLLPYPGREVSALELASEVRESTRTLQETSQEGLRVGDLGDLGVQLDDKAMTEYREQIGELDETLKSSSLGETERAKLSEEKALIENLLSGALGLGGRSRPVGSASERARSNVTQAVARAIVAIEKHDPGLAQFLRNSIKTGYVCTYSPDTPVRWAIT